MTMTTDGIEMRLRSWAVVEHWRFDRYQFKIGGSGGMVVIANEWILGPQGMIARVDGGDPGDEDDGE